LSLGSFHALVSHTRQLDADRSTREARALTRPLATFAPPQADGSSIRARTVDAAGRNTEGFDTSSSNNRNSATASETATTAPKPFFGTPAPSSLPLLGVEEAPAAALALASSEAELWPPLPQLSDDNEEEDGSSQYEHQVASLREWLRATFALVLTPAQELAPSALRNPLRNGTLLALVARVFLARSLEQHPAYDLEDGSGTRALARDVKALLPIKHAPASIEAALENNVRALEVLRRVIVLERRNDGGDAMSAAAGPSTAAAVTTEAPLFASLLRSMSARVEAIVERLLHGDRSGSSSSRSGHDEEKQDHLHQLSHRTAWSLLAYLRSEWERDHSDDGTTGAVPQAAADDEQEAPWSLVELALLEWMQSVGVGNGVLGTGGSAGSGTSGGTKAQRQSQQQQLQQPISVAAFLSLFRKGVLLCDLVAATWPHNAAVASSARPFSASSSSLVRSSAPFPASLGHVDRDPRTWAVCRSNLRKALGALARRGCGMSMHLLREHTEATLESLLAGRRSTIMQLLYDVYAAHVGEPPHDKESECMGRSSRRRRSSSSKAKHTQLQTAAPTSTKAIAPSQSKQVVPLLTSTSVSGSAGAAGVAGSDNDTTARMVSEALQLHAWLRGLQLRSVNERVGNAPAVLLSVAEMRRVNEEQRASLLAISNAASPENTVAAAAALSATSVFSDGLVLCDVVSALRRAPLTGVVRGGSLLLSSGSVSRHRASSLHNVELAFEALRHKMSHSSRMPLTLLYREVARAIVRDEDEEEGGADDEAKERRLGARALLRALFRDMRAAFPAASLTARTGLMRGRKLPA
jgi:hypothetical protein